MRRIMFLLVALFIGLQAFAQTTISGTVTDSNGEPVPGANVRAKGYSDVGTITDLNGSYTLKVPTEATTLVVSFVGMKASEVEIGGQTVINVTLEGEDVGIDEVVVTALGITREQKELGYGVQTVSGDDIATSPNSDMINSLSGRTAGVEIVSSAGTAGASSFITIRGSASITGNNQPLFIVDGVPINSGGGIGTVDGVAESKRTIDINPDDIESMSVLKGGAATALYGLRAANGAIIIKTKAGKNNQKLQIDFHTSFGFDKISQVPAMQRKFAQGNDGAWISGHQRSWGPDVSTLQYMTDPNYIWDTNGQIVDENDPNANGMPVQTYDQYDFFQTGQTFNNTLSISAGNEKSTYYFSVGNLKQIGIVPNNDFKRNSFKFNATSKLWDNFTVGSNLTFSNSQGNRIQQGSNVSGIMLGLLRTPPTFDNSAGYEFPDGSQRTYRNGGGYDNPYWVANNITYNDITNRFIGSTFLDYVATDWMKFNYRIGFDYTSRRIKETFAIGSNAQTDGYVGEYFNNQMDMNSDFLVTFTKNFGDFGTRLTLGNNLYSTHYKSTNGWGTGLAIPDYYQLNNAGTQQTSSATSEYRTMAVFADLSVSYKDMVYFGATLRNDWATTMPKDKNSALYPSVSLGFVFTELPMLKGNNIFSFGKFRTSWAKVANIAIPYRTVSTFEKPSYFSGWTGDNDFQGPLALNGQSYTVFQHGTTLYSPALTHENMESFEVGVELNFLNNRVGLDVAYFLNKNSDLLLYVPVAPTSGFGNSYQNAASMLTEGSEWSLTATPVKLANGFQWDLMVNFTKFRNPVTELAPGVDNVTLGGFTVPSSRAVVGQEYRTIYGIDWVRDAQGRVVINDDPTDAHPDGYPFPNDAAGQVPIGNFNADWTANMTNTFSFKGVRLSFLIDIKRNGRMYNGTMFAMNYFGTTERTVNREVSYLPNGQIDFDNTPAENIVVYDGVYGHFDADGNIVTSGVTNTTPVVNDENWYEGYGSNFGGGPSVAAMENGGWVRLREISLGYTFPKSIIGGLKWLQGLEVYFVGKNLWLDTPYSGIDPESSLLGSSNAQGMDYFNMPGTKSYNFGLKLRF